MDRWKGKSEDGLADARVALYRNGMNSTGWLFAAAGYNLALTVFHLGFWRIFRWREELPKLHLVNRGVMQVMNCMLIFVFLSMAVLQVVYAAEFTGTSLGRGLLLFMAGFWIVRAILQPVFFRRTAVVSWVFFLVFLAGAVLHAAAWWSAWPAA